MKGALAGVCFSTPAFVLVNVSKHRSHSCVKFELRRNSTPPLSLINILFLPHGVKEQAIIVSFYDIRTEIASLEPR